MCKLSNTIGFCLCKLTTSFLPSNLLSHLHTSNLPILILLLSKATTLQVHQSELVDHLYITVHNNNRRISWGSKAETEWHYTITSLKVSTLYHLSLQVKLEGPSLPVRPYIQHSCSLNYWLVALSTMQVQLPVLVSINKEDMAWIEVRPNLECCTVPMFVVSYEVWELWSFLQLLPNVENQISVWAEPSTDGEINIHLDLVRLYSLVYSRR